MDEASGLMALIERLYAIVAEAWNVPMGNDRCIVNRNEVLEIINAMKAQVPAELAEAKRLLSAREDFILNARHEAESMRRVAEDQANQLIEREEIVRSARARSTELIAGAESKAQELTRATNDYVNDALSRTEEAMSAALEELRQTRQRFRNASGTRPVQPQGGVRQREVTPIDVDDGK